MALISGIANFFSRTSLLAADLDNSFGAVVQQIGGTYWSGTTAVVAPGGLDVSNFKTSGLGLTNAHKAQPNSLLAICIPYPSRSGSTKQTAFGGAVDRNLIAVAASMKFGFASAGGQAIKASDGASDAYFVVKANGVPLGIVPLGNATTSSTGNPLDIPAVGVFNEDLHVGDQLSIELENIFPQGGATISDLLFTIWCRVPHLT